MIFLKKNRRLLSIFFFLNSYLLAFNLFGQSNLSETAHKDRIMWYAGDWVSSVSSNSDSIAEKPELRVSCRPTMNNQSLQVEVFQMQDGVYKNIVSEQLSYDQKSDSLFALGQNGEGVLFLGKGTFSNHKNGWDMLDIDMSGKPFMTAKFTFNNFTDLSIEGFDPSEKSLWKVKYIKQNSKRKNIGIQLVSVHEDMLKDPEGTLKQLGRMGYSFVETFVYSDGLFYGMKAQEFKASVEKQGMKFLGSMTFYDLPQKGKWEEAMKWWQNCIADHKKAGVEYLSTSNHQLKQVRSEEELEAYCKYYNAVGKLCKENGLTFVYHNHADEFLEVNGKPIYDYFLAHTNPEYVSFQSDLYWMYKGGVDPKDYFEKYPKRFVSWHMKDEKELGESGKIDFKELIKLKELAGLQYLVAEVEDYSYPPLFSVNLAWRYIFYDLLDEISQ
ncbi:sugar phosphate isomerase/epimerase family protein [Sediminitomix flava]|uniref:Sugar phosphate isomerase/epimerase n=1 Tax=Sediminitomix flava TaxID=379075 RepID=A0A315Z8S5_SEDFL|nr:sugar phosphate isomerase/epimerase [Sediminitomix flava]PWJ41901.1 sugar phosphate isomerase/epimerase [Sediminitomix flava]